MCFLHINSLGYSSELFRISTSMIPEAVFWSLQIPWCSVFTHSVFCCCCKPWMQKAWSASKQSKQTGEVPGKWKGFIFFSRTFESLGLLKCLRCIHCWLHLFSRLIATTSQWKTLQKLWKNSRPRLASRRLWNISVTSLHYMGSSQIQEPSCMMDTHLQPRWTWSQHPTWTSWLSFGELLWQDTHAAIQFIPVLDVKGAAVPMATSPHSIHLIQFLFPLPGSTRNWFKHLLRACFHGKTDPSVQLLCNL